MPARTAGPATQMGGTSPLLFAVVGLAGDGPTGVVLVFESATAADGWAKEQGFGDYRVVPAWFATTRVPAVIA